MYSRYAESKRFRKTLAAVRVAVQEATANGHLPAFLAELELVRSVREHANDLIAPRMLGMLQTSWGSFAEFVEAYYKKPKAGDHSAGAVHTFKALFKEMRRESAGPAEANSLSQH